MSSIGPSSIGATNLAGSFAGTQQTDGNKDARQARAAESKMQVDQKASAAHGDDDVTETELSSERDAEGQIGYGAQGDTELADDTEESEEANEKSARRAIDTDGVRGAGLDLDA